MPCAPFLTVVPAGMDQMPPVIDSRSLRSASPASRQCLLALPAANVGSGADSHLRREPFWQPRSTPSLSSGCPTIDRQQPVDPLSATATVGRSSSAAPASPRAPLTRPLPLTCACAARAGRSSRSPVNSTDITPRGRGRGRSDLQAHHVWRLAENVVDARISFRSAEARPDLPTGAAGTGSIPCGCARQETGTGPSFSPAGSRCLRPGAERPWACLARRGGNRARSTRSAPRSARLQGTCRIQIDSNGSLQLRAIAAPRATRTPAGRLVTGTDAMHGWSWARSGADGVEEACNCQQVGDPGEAVAGLRAHDSPGSALEPCHAARSAVTRCCAASGAVHRGRCRMRLVVLAVR
jgi:hypothetical protein